MSVSEIKDLIASKIAGQGNQVDSGGKLAEILNEIVDMASQGESIYISCGYDEVEAEPTFDDAQKALLLQAYQEGNLARVICVNKNEVSQVNRYFKVVSWEDSAIQLSINGANIGGTTTVKRWQVVISH